MMIMQGYDIQGGLLSIATETHCCLNNHDWPSHTSLSAFVIGAQVATSGAQILNIVQSAA